MPEKEKKRVERNENKFHIGPQTAQRRKTDKNLRVSVVVVILGSPASCQGPAVVGCLSDTLRLEKGVREFAPLVPPSKFTPHPNRTPWILLLAFNLLNFQSRRQSKKVLAVPTAGTAFYHRDLNAF